MVVGWRWGYDIYVVMLYQHLVSLVHRTGCLHVTVVQSIEVDVYDRALLAVLLVVYPSDYRTEIVECYLVDKAVLAMEWDGERIVLMEEVEGMDQRISISEETVNTLLLLGSNVLEATLGKVTVFLDEPLVTISSFTPSFLGFWNSCLPVMLLIVSPILKAGVLRGCGRNPFSSSVYMPPIEVPMMRSGLLSLRHLLQHFYALFRMYRDVFSHEGGIRHQFLQHLYGAALCRREETVNIHDFSCPP